MDEVRKIKYLQTQLNIATSEKEGLKIEIANKKSELQQKNKYIWELTQIIKSLNNNGSIKISEHAMLRYLERVQGIDLTEIESKLLSEKTLNEINTLGNGTYPVDDFHIVVKDKTVVTIKTKEG